MVRVERDFFARDTVTVAQELPGKVLCRKINGKTYRGIIVETEAYTQDDPACHAHKRITKRSKSLFCKPGTTYVYLIYGVHHCVNFVTYKEGYGSGVLIRALEPLNFEGANMHHKNCSGPGKLTRSLQITKEFDGYDSLAQNPLLWIEYGEKIAPEDIIQTTRVGIAQGKELLWRFYIKGNACVSRK